MNFNIVLNASDRATATLGRFGEALKSAWSQIKSGTASGAVNGLIGLSTAFTAVTGGIGIAVSAFNRLLTVGAEYLEQQSQIERATNRLARTMGNRSAAQAEATAITASPLGAVFSETELIAADNNLRRLTKNALGGSRDLQLLADVAVDTDENLGSLAQTIGVITSKLQAGDESFSRYAMQLVQSRAVTADVVVEMQRMVTAGRSAGEVIDYLFTQLNQAHGGAFEQVNNDLNDTARKAQDVIDDVNRELTSTLYPALRDFGLSFKAVLLTGLNEVVKGIQDAAAWLARGGKGAPPEATGSATETDRASAVNAGRTPYQMKQEEIDAMLKVGADERARVADLDRENARANEQAAVELMSPEQKIFFMSRKADEAKAAADDFANSELERAESRKAYLEYAAGYRRARNEYIAALRAQAAETKRQTEEEKRQAEETTRSINDQIKAGLQANAAKAQEQVQAAADQKDFAAQTQQKADAARERFFNPAIAKQEAQAAKEKANQDQRLSRMAARARAAGYELQAAPGGEFNAVKSGSLGPTSKRLAEALELEAKRKFAEQQKRDAERLQADAAKAQVEAAKLLAQIEQNTKAGPVV
jgi:hypothetical protein